MKVAQCNTKQNRALCDQTMRTAMWHLFHSASAVKEVNLFASVFPGRVYDKDHTYSAANVQHQTDNEGKLIAC